MKEKMRLDLLVGECYPHLSRSFIQSVIMRGMVTVNGVVQVKSGSQVTRNDRIEVHDDSLRYVSRAGYKLEAALDIFALEVTGLVALDAGISTGGFTDCLLQKGVARVYGVDVGSLSLIHI